MRLGIKLAIMCSAAVVIALSVASVFLYSQFSTRVRDASFRRLKAETAAATSVYDERLAQMQLAAATLADEIGSKSLLGAGGASSVDPQSRAKLQDLLSSERDRISLDFVIVGDASGVVIARQNDSPQPGEVLTSATRPNLIVDATIAEGGRFQTAPVSGCAVEQADFLARMWLDKAAKIEGSRIDQALVIEAAAPIVNSDKFLGVILAGQMLNNYYVARPGSGELQTPLVASVHRGVSSDSDDSGALIALGNSIIASSVFRSGNSDPIFRGSKCYTDTEFENLTDSGRSYVVSWQSIKSADGQKIGAIGVAAPSDRLNEGSLIVLVALLGAAVAGGILAALAGLAFGGMLAARLKALTDAVNRMSLGELSTEIRDRPGVARPNGLLGKLSKLPPFGMRHGSNGAGSLPASTNGSDEIGALTEQLEQMRSSFRMAIERLRRR